MPRDVYFDLDGTLTDPFQGITLSIQYALRELSADVPPQQDLAAYIGPPLRAGFSRLLGTTDSVRVERAVTLYRERYAEIGLFENHVYDGVPFMLETLTLRGHTLLMATSKPRVYAERIAEQFGLAGYFKEIFGSELDGRLDDKRELLAHALTLHPFKSSPSLMIGDRDFDVNAARVNGMNSIGVSYGYGSREELTSAGADSICDSPPEVAERASERTD